MSSTRKVLYCSVLAIAALAAQPASALDIVLTNDDGFESSLTYAVYQALHAAGHRVLISASTTAQSGRGGSVDLLRPVGALTSATRGGCVLPLASPAASGVGNLGFGAPFVAAGCPADPNIFWVNGTPVASALYGIDVAAPLRFGKQLDLVVSGPNFGNSTGLINSSSGTVNGSTTTSYLCLSVTAKDCATTATSSSSAHTRSILAAPRTSPT